jgi:TP901 family phage tail tape measure protein
MSDDEFAQYTKNLETVKGMAEQMADAMDDVTKGSLLTLASAIENVCIAAFNKLKPVIRGTADAINEFFDTWHNGETNEFTFTGLEKGLSGLADKVRAQEGNMKQAVVDLFASDR